MGCLCPLARAFDDVHIVLDGLDKNPGAQGIYGMALALRSCLELEDARRSGSCELERPAVASSVARRRVKTPGPREDGTQLVASPSMLG